MLRRRVFSARGLAASAIVALLCLVAGAQAQTPAQKLLLLSGTNRPALTLNLLAGTLPSQVVFTRASSATTALYTDAAGATVTSYGTNVARVEARGFLVETVAATNFLLNSAAPVTQTTGSLATGTYVLFCNGTGSVTSSVASGTASGVGALTCNSSTFQTITVTVAATLTMTVSGSVNWFDLQKNVAPTSHIICGASTCTRSADVATVPTSAFPYNPNASTIVAQVMQIVTLADGSTPQQIIEMDDGSASNFVEVYFRGAASNFARQIEVSNSQVLHVDAGTALGVGVVQKIGYSWQVGGASLYANNTLIGHDTPASIPVVTTLRLGGRVGNANPLNGWVREMDYYNKRLPDTQLQALTH